MEMKLGTHAYYIISMTTTVNFIGGLPPFIQIHVVVYKNEWRQVNKKYCEFKKRGIIIVMV